MVNFLGVKQFLCEKIEFSGLGKSGTYFYGLGPYAAYSRVKIDFDGPVRHSAVHDPSLLILMDLLPLNKKPVHHV